MEQEMGMNWSAGLTFGDLSGGWGGGGAAGRGGGAAEHSLEAWGCSMCLLATRLLLDQIDEAVHGLNQGTALPLRQRLQQQPLRQAPNDLPQQTVHCLHLCSHHQAFTSSLAHADVTWCLPLA